ncbi:hypothetical protein A3A76_02065 [Candidatus Woesebacteria bacterium RIFCSPLOWO2_01_FULL_39_23]|uniref:DUF218 domain-containing protein n=1 Tax=Candidatus Woesebacteria bacterium RIFCSPHIGHO2_01_FULL_40_22 TaxID=1802499 RepID=A0A1F7YFS0_9BACT|nr:MAG: hypothetical protein A2141_03210 [Candidatus Woesebacteria bacterium RBG_16_40_11]OGM26184.1 MAG: hypothetical protein A2628_02495 [Candidatus Woesebacteria bacterium RIFCSPHIGHO2_01_FULL_40_22]OGM37971.1 MAG: hypothetical protein A3E41_03575 [Candidatus Woesebacteria bacterium RIFCSPHIGHO2_12_FULL_38_9]OGM62343.1 MAG: hypothetical protein A3A76_02065 [Candidatus Woesebacteria bacterium RIFCSPLOWO2_01_FULL_39_23]
MIYDAGIILGHSYFPLGFSSRQKKRMNKVLELYKEKKIKYIITTGGVGGLFNPTSKPLGKLTKEYLVSMGVEKGRTVEDNRSVNTYENAKFSLSLMRKHNLSSALIVTSADHMGRARMIFNDVFPSSIKLDFVVSDYFSGLWSIWDFFWHAAGWVKYLIRKSLKLDKKFISQPFKPLLQRLFKPRGSINH